MWGLGLAYHLENSYCVGHMVVDISCIYPPYLAFGRYLGLSRQTVSRGHLAENQNVCVYSLLDGR